MTPADLRSARKALGLTQHGLAEALRMGANGGRTVRRWELGEIPITGPASVAIELLEQKAKVKTKVKTA
jgi:DNA-binding transcriptional regulator YiaG